MLYTIKKLSIMNFIDWDTYEKEVENQILALWENHEKEKIIEARILRKLIRSQVQIYLSHSEEERAKDLELSPEEIVLGLIKKINLNISTIENRIPPHTTRPTVPLLEYK